MSRVLITGISGAIGRKVASLLLSRGHTVSGVDRRPWPDAPRQIEIASVDIRKRAAEDVIRTKRPDTVIHMATITHFKADPEERYRVNLGGTRAVFEQCHKYGVKEAIFVGRHTFYGAAADAPLYHTESDPPLAVSTFPELADLVAADLFAASALWRFADMNTVVLRTVYTLGPSLTGTMATYIRPKRVPTVLGFDPLYHFMHEDDCARAIADTVGRNLKGIFNVAGPQPVPLSAVLDLAGRSRVRVPEQLYNAMLGRFGFPKLPPGAL
ncbi:MAG TPA: NAD-dependent epimerase/dehydratase family protein, partial [Myxococcota bacterium]